MSRKNNVEFRVGVIVILALAILSVSMYWLQGYRLEKNSRLLQVRFDDVGSLAVGDKVTVSGVNSGKVSSLTLSTEGVMVEILLSREVELSADAVFAIRNIGVMGDRFIAINPGRSEQPIDTLAVARGSSDSGMPKIMGLLGETINELRGLVASIRENVRTEATFEKFNQTLSNLNRASSLLIKYLERNESNLDQTVVNLQSASARLNNMVERNSILVDSSLTRIERASIGLGGFVANLDTIAVSVRVFTDGLAQGDGTLQALVEDKRLYDDLRQAADNLDDLITDIKENPGKYINLKFELF